MLKSREVYVGAQLNAVSTVFVEISVVLGRTNLPIHQLLKMGRGAVIELDADADEEVWLLANNIPIARGQIVVQGDKIAISITSTVRAVI
jgi:flagellar motor switch protein FliN/FliY